MKIENHYKNVWRRGYAIVVTLGRKLSENGKSAITSGLLVAHGNLKSFRICLSLKKKKM